MNETVSFDALLPGAMATKAEDLGVKKAALPAMNMFALAVLAGAFIGIGAIFATTVAAGGMSVKDAAGAAAFSTGLPYGVTRLLVGLAFTVGLILVVVGGAELFTGNNLISMAFASKKVTFGALLRNWVIVYVGNFVGSILTAYIVFLGKQYAMGNGAIGAAKGLESFEDFLGIMQHHRCRFEGKRAVRLNARRMPAATAFKFHHKHAVAELFAKNKLRFIGDFVFRVTKRKNFELHGLPS